MAKITIAQKFTDIEYLSKKEVADQIGNSGADGMWRQVSEYREKYRFPLDVKRFDYIPFSVVLTPSIMGIPNTTEREMIKFTSLFEKYLNKQEISETKSLDVFKKDVIVEDLYVMSLDKEINIGQKDIEVMLDPNNMHLKDSIMYSYYKAHEYLVNNPSAKFDVDLFRQLYAALSKTPVEDNINIYRTHNDFVDGANNTSIEELISGMFEFYNSGLEISPFVIASVIYVYIVYVKPFTNYNEEMALLLFMKTLADLGYGNSAYYLSIGQFLMQKKNELKLQLDEIAKSGDITYGIIFLSKVSYDAIVWRYQALSKLPEPEPSYGNVRVIEKVVEKIVEKEVPVYIEKPVEKVVEKKVEVKPTEFFKAPVNNTKAKESNKEKFEFETDPFLMFEDKDESAPVSEPYEIKKEEIKKIDQEILEAKNAKIEEPKDFYEAAPIKKSEAKVSAYPAVSKDIKNRLAELEGLDDVEFAKKLVELHPLIKYHQALFYATHKTPGRYYSISQFKDFNDCAYETARTSMDFLTSLGLYKKEQFKNKFVYLVDEEGR